MRLAPGLHRVGDDRVACYIVDEAGDLTIVDAGLSGHYGDLLAELGDMGRSLDDVRAVVLTHGHADHIGFAERLRSERGIPVSVHALDAALARGEVPNPSAGLGERKLVSILSFLVYGIRKGALRTRPLVQVASYGSGTTLDVPGALTVVATPGHTPGSCSLRAAGHDALFVGDALCTYSVATGRQAPQISPFTADPDEALASLTSLESVEAGWLLPGHGAPWTEGTPAALASARRIGIGHLPRP